MGVGESRKRVDAFAKVTGEARYTADLMPEGLLVAKVVHSTIANGWVKRFDLSEALAVPGVVKIVTCMDVPDLPFPTPGHPWSVEPAHQDIRDRKLLNRRVRVYGDDIAAVIAENELAAVRAARLVKAEYEEYAPLLTVEQAMACLLYTSGAAPCGASVLAYRAAGEGKAEPPGKYLSPPETPCYGDGFHHGMR